MPAAARAKPRKSSNGSTRRDRYNAKRRRATEQKIERVEKMLKRGLSVPQIAARIGYSYEGARKLALQTRVY